MNGEIDDISVSNVARSGDWIQTEYNNQASPSTFYSLSSLSSVKVVPSVAALFPAQSQQFAASGTCNADLTWTMPSGAQGTLTSSGLYTAPESIATQQIVTVTATGQNGTAIGSAIVDLLPSPTPITLAAPVAPPYATGTAQTFVATLTGPERYPRIGCDRNVHGLGRQQHSWQRHHREATALLLTRISGPISGPIRFKPPRSSMNSCNRRAAITAIWTVQTPPIAAAASPSSSANTRTRRAGRSLYG